MIRTIRFRPLLTSDAPARPERYRLVASRAFSTWRGDAFEFMTCDCSAGSAGVDVEECEEPGL